MEESRGERVLEKSVASQQHRVRRTFGPAQYTTVPLTKKDPPKRGPNLENYPSSLESWPEVLASSIFSQPSGPAPDSFDLISLTSIIGFRV